MQYKDVDFGHPLYDYGASATVGIQNTPSQGKQYSHNTPALSNELAILFLPPGKTVTYPVRVVDVRFAVTTDTPVPDRTPITNTAVINSSAGDSLTRQVVALARGPNFTASSMTADPPTPRPGEVVTFTIWLRNDGALERSVQLSDALPPELGYVKGSLTYETGSGYFDLNNVLNWTGNIWAGTQSPVRFRATVDATSTHNQAITNTAVFTSTWLGEVFYPQATLVVQKPADAFVSLVGSGTLYPLTETLANTITYSNAGPFATERPVTVTAVLPDGVTFLGATSPGVYHSGSNSVAWNVGVLNVGSYGTLTVSVAAPGSLPALSILTTTVSLSALPQDPNPNDNTSQWFSVVGSNVNLLNGTRKTMDRLSVHRGSVVTYTLVVSNTGRATAAASVADPIPAGVVYIPNSSRVNATPIELFDPAQNRIAWNGAIPAGGAVTIGFRVAVTATPGSRVTNQVTFDDGAGLLFERWITSLPVRYTIYLPMMARNP